MPRPYITLKLATSLDGKIALSNGQSEWITGEKSREEGRKLRASHDAIAVGANTAVLDNPQLTTRIDGAKDPVRIIFDTQLRLPLHSNLALSARDVPVWMFSNVRKGEKYEALDALGLKILNVPMRSVQDVNKGLDIDIALDVLKRRGISRLLLEGGGTLAASFLRQDYIDAISWFRAPLILGADGRDGIGELELASLDMAKQFSRVEIMTFGQDIYEKYERIN